MNQGIRIRHRRAMDLAWRAFRSGEPNAKKRLFSQAMRQEVKCARMIDATAEAEPTRSILYRSAAWLAFNAGDIAEARKLTDEGLTGFPPAQIAAELRDVMAAIESLQEK